MTPSKWEDLNSFFKGLGGVLVMPLGCLFAPVGIPMAFFDESRKRHRAIQAAERLHCVKCGHQIGRAGMELAEGEAAATSKSVRDANPGVRIDFLSDFADGIAKCPNIRCDAQYVYVDAQPDFILIKAEAEPDPSPRTATLECDPFETDHSSAAEGKKPAAERLGETVGCWLIGLIVLAGIGFLIHAAIFVMMNPVTS